MPDHAKEVEKNFSRLEMTSNVSPNYGIIYSYVEWILDLPWEDYSEDKLDLELAKKVLDQDHHGLEKVKKRIIEYLAVLKLKKDMKVLFFASIQFQVLVKL